MQKSILYSALIILLLATVVISSGKDTKIDIILYQAVPAEFSPNGDGINDQTSFIIHAIVSTDKVSGNALIQWNIEARRTDNNNKVWKTQGTVVMNSSGVTEFTINTPWDGCMSGTDYRFPANRNNFNSPLQCDIAPDGQYTHTLNIHYKSAHETESGLLAINTSAPDFLIISPADSSITSLPTIEISGRSSPDITEIHINNAIFYPISGYWSAMADLTEGENSITVVGITADNRSKMKMLNIIRKSRFRAFLSEFDGSLPALEPYDGLAGVQDVNPDIAYESNTYNRGTGS